MRQSFTLRGHHVLIGMIGFFGIIIAVNVFMAVLAVQSFPGEDVRRSYLQGLNYNETLAERRAQAAMGWQARAELREVDGVVWLETTLHTRDGAPLTNATIEGALRWPANERLDHALTFQNAGDGRYLARVGDLARGRWDVRATATNANGALDFEANLTWPPR